MDVKIINRDSFGAFVSRNKGCIQMEQIMDCTRKIPFRIAECVISHQHKVKGIEYFLGKVLNLDFFVETTSLSFHVNAIGTHVAGQKAR